VPKNLRQILAAESAVNDGMAYPFISIALYLTLDSSYRQAFGDWFLVGWLCMFLVKISALITLSNGSQIRLS
jgi:NhaP-type Na+/H+ or K+/H+ antiporter